MMYSRLVALASASITKRYSTLRSRLDYSKVPVLNEDDLEEQFVRGSGPGGQKINKTASCVVLKHIPTALIYIPIKHLLGLVVKCQETRFLHQNRKFARLHLVTKLDNHLNGENSVEAQTKRLQEKKSNATEQKKEKLRLLKEKWKQDTVE